MKRVLMVLAGVVALAGAAQADVCSNLQQQYLAAGGGTTRGAATGTDVASLNRQLQSYQAAAQQNQCNGGFFGGFFGSPPPSPNCGAINQQIAYLQDQIRRSYSSGAVGFGGFGGFGGGLMNFANANSQADQIRYALAANGCSVPGTGSSGGGGNRTICVRSCDGYYFPISDRASSASIKEDAQTCEAMYGGPDKAQLFLTYSGGDVADATPAAGGGKRYGSQPYAFAYRSSFNAACAAQLQDGVASLSTAWANRPGTTTAAGTTVAAVAPKDPVPTPVLRGARLEDPETLANFRGDIQPAPVLFASAPGNTRNGIRVVGAGYYNTMLDQIAESPVHSGVGLTP